jgi:hypothetical protein
VVRRFQIEDMVAQDAAGIVFRALDRQTGELVAIRRFLPFGVNGGGLSDEEQAEYQVVVERLCAIRHPAMRSVIGGGCDAVDGMPYLATEWIEGISVHTLIERKRLTLPETIYTIVQALEVCEEISHVLEREAVWIEVDLRAIIIGAEEGGRPLTFGISPLKWLGKHDGQHGLDSIVNLTEELMGWRGKTIHAHESGGLGGWLKWLHRAAKTTTLSEAKRHLLQVSDIKSPVPTKRILSPVTHTRNEKAIKRRSSMPFLIGAIAALSATSLTGWCLIRWNHSEPFWPANWKSLDFSTEKTVKNSNSSLRKKKQEATSRKEVFDIADSVLFLTMAGQEVTLGGVLEGFKYSNSRATLYLIFSKDPPNDQVRGAVIVKNASANIKEKELTALVGKRITLRGKIRIESFANRPVVVIEKRSNIQEVN